MEIWFLIIVSVCIAALLKSIISLLIQANQNYPPGPLNVPIISTIKWLRWSSSEAEAALRTLQTKFGPIFTVRRGARPLIFISSNSLAHEALVQKGAIFADRPKALLTSKIINSNQRNISSAGYGPTWRILRRNLTSQFLHPSRVKKYSHARKWVLDILISNIRNAGESNDGVVTVMDHFRFTMFCLLVLMCFGDKLDEPQIRQIEDVQHKLIVSFTRFQILNFLPQVTRIVLRGRWNELYSLRKRQEKVLIPLINMRRSASGEKLITSYVDTLLTLEIQDEEDENKRKLTEGELVTACSEFLTAGTDTTSTALQWIMANLVKYPDVQSKLFDEIKEVVGQVEKEEVSEEDLSKMPYLKAVVLEGLRRHPPGHFVLPHTVTQDVELGGYTIPKNAVINFMVAEMGWDPKVWEDPMEFKPERFLTNDGEESFDITGSREIKMMPFGVGRRICPSFGLAILHLEYFVANLVWNFEWKAVDEVDLSEKQEFTVVMKHPLNAHVSPRAKFAN